MLWLAGGLLGLRTSAQSVGADLPALRKLYAAAVVEEAASRQFVAVVRAYHGSDAAVIGYCGVAEAVQARYFWSPLAKLRAVREAQRQFSRAVALDPQNVEVRFLRFSVESHVPRYLGYSQHLADDRIIILRGAQHYTSLGLNASSLRLIRDFMLLHGDCSAAEARVLRAMTP